MAHDSSLPPGSILLRTMPLIVPRYGGALLFMAVHARCSDRSSVLSLFSPPPLPLHLHIRNRGIKMKKKKKMEKSKWVSIIVRDGYPNKCYLNSFLMTLNHPLSLPHRSRSRIGNRSTFLLIVRRSLPTVAPFPLEFGKRRKKGKEKSRDEKNWNRHHHHHRKSSRTI